MPVWFCLAREEPGIQQACFVSYVHVLAWPWQQGLGYSRIESSTCATIPIGALGEGFLETGFVFLVRGGIMRAPLVHTPAVLYMATKCLWHRNEERVPYIGS